MTISEIMQKMIAFSNGNRHDINHLLKVWGYAKTIGDAEKLDQLLHSDVTPASRRSMGLRNVRDRLRLLYGEEAAVSIFQSAPGVILAQISLPL